MKEELLFTKGVIMQKMGNGGRCIDHISIYKGVTMQKMKADSFFTEGVTMQTIG
ncbi:hypothetical protein KSS87_020617, partial [Heliosperma pusillum]